MTLASSRSLVEKWARRVDLLIKLGVEALGILLVAASALGGPHSSGFIAQTRAPRRPRVVVVKAPDCPLRISTIDTEGLSAHNFELGLVVVNAGVRPITAYTITYSCSGKCPFSGSASTYMGVIGSGASNLDSGQSSETQLGGVDGSSAIERVEVGVDFVEFSDGTTWGPDLKRTAQMLDGMRAGAREAQAYLKGVFQFGGDYGLASATATEHLPLEPPKKNNNPEWDRGFRLGRDNIRTRIRHALETKGSEEAAKFLNQPLGS